MYDLLALAFEGDLTRSATYMLGKDLSGASFPESGFNGAWHGSSHHGDKPENVANYAKMNRYHVQNLAYFAEKLSKIPDGDGTLLDHILIYKGSNMGNSHRHAHIKVPVILLGGLDGTFQGQPPHRVSGQHGAHLEHAARAAAQVRHRRHSEVRCGWTPGRDAEVVRFQHEAAFAVGCMRSALVTIAILVALAVGRAGTEPRGPKIERPDGPVWEVIRKNCTACHGIDDYAFYALDQAGWSKLIAEKHKPATPSFPMPTAICCSAGWRKGSVLTPSRFREPTFRPRSRRSSPIPRRSA